MWNERYSTSEFAYGTEPNDFLREQVKALDLSGGKALCLAEGEGRNAVYLAQCGYSVTAVDFSEQGLLKARQLAEKKEVEIETICADLACYKSRAEQFDVVVMIFAHTPPAVRAHALEQARHALRSKGVFILEGYGVDQIGRGTGGPPEASLMFDQAELERVFSKDTVVLNHQTERDIREGRYHTGMGVVVQCVVRKS